MPLPIADTPLATARLPFRHIVTYVSLMAGQRCRVFDIILPLYNLISSDIRYSTVQIDTLLPGAISAFSPRSSFACLLDCRQLAQRFSLTLVC